MMSPVSTDWCTTDTHLTASPASMPDPDEEGKMICQTSFFLSFFFFFPGENPWMADVHPNPLSNRKHPRSGGGGGDCCCLLAGVLLQWLVRGSLFSGQEQSGLTVGCSSAWNSTWRSGAAFVSKPLQILTEEPKLGMEGKIVSLQHNIHQTVSSINHSRAANVTSSPRGCCFN